ncbi:DUF523 and DUF1722 domain-containing protein [Pseudomonas sp. RIT-PI-S]|uniref:YbgA family protein n=1 Tax=Pseudomonas sp. RIT-PI-S TaxID=3035295 RepID=UPI0021DAED49|nr:DUF523 and DUF1722 domain-containing protein [Pseudomonas sp. RIT-PI-S]
MRECPSSDLPALPEGFRPKLAISACLIGEEVRYNGGHKASQFCTRVLAEHVDFVPVCPEVAVGLGVPRQPIRLVGDAAQPRALGSVTPSLDVTAPLAEYGERMAASLSGVSGYIFMHKSPSCGLERVKVYREDGVPGPDGGRGLYAQAFCAARPDLPVEEDGRLCDPVLRENFLVRVYAYAQWQHLLAHGLTKGRLLAFHARYKYQLMANHPQHYKTLGRLLGSMGRDQAETIAPHYFSALMAALSRCATRGTHSNVLQHIAGYLRGSLDRAGRQELEQLIAQYRNGVVPLVVPLTLLKHLFRLYPHPYIAGQVYLQPHPETLSLRNAI